MAETNIGAARASENSKKDYSVDTLNTDGVTDAKETFYINTKWPQWHGYYKKIPELKQAIDAKARWTMGKGFKADPVTTLILGRITGWGKETFNTILENMIKVMYVGGDAFSEIIIDDSGFLLNLKPLDPGSIKIVVDGKGILKRYEQVSKIEGMPNKKFNPEEIFHLSKDRFADEIHGTSVIESCEQVILMRNEAMSDWKKVLHRNIDPMMIWHVDTDDDTRISEIKRKIDAARGSGENMYVPKGIMIPEQISIAPQSTLNPTEWIKDLNQDFYQAVGVPDIILGNSQTLTEASAKTAYLAYEQTIEEDQLYVEEQVLSQLNLEINLEFPASLRNEMLDSRTEDEQRLVPGQGIGITPPEVEQQGSAIEPNDMTVEMEGRK